MCTILLLGVNVHSSCHRTQGLERGSVPVGSQIVEEDALCHASLDGDSIVALMHLNREVRRHLNRVCGILHPASRKRQMCGSPLGLPLGFHQHAGRVKLWTQALDNNWAFTKPAGCSSCQMWATASKNT